MGVGQLCQQNTLTLETVLLIFGQLHKYVIHSHVFEPSVVLVEFGAFTPECAYFERHRFWKLAQWIYSHSATNDALIALM